MELDSQVIMVYVHSPLMQYSSPGSYYTSYSISLKSNHPCFTHSYSQVRRRYSEFRYLRNLLQCHHPTIKPPELPPKSYFRRFNDSLIEERKLGLQKFLEQVLSIPVYLSDKSLHLFLQSTCSMSQVGEECIGDIPVPQLVDGSTDSGQSETGSTTSFESSKKNEGNRVQPIAQNLDKTPKANVGNDYLPTKYNGSISCPLPIRACQKNTILRDKNIQWDKRNGNVNQLCDSLGSVKSLENTKRVSSLDSSPSSSISSVEGSFTVPEDHIRRVSFNENVTVAVVYNQLWNIGVKRIRTNT